VTLVGHKTFTVLLLAALIAGFFGGMAGSVIMASAYTTSPEVREITIMPRFEGQCAYKFGTDGVAGSWGGRLMISAVQCEDARALLRFQPRNAGYAIWGVPLYTNHTWSKGLELSAQGGNWPKVLEGDDWAGYDSTTLDLLAQRKSADGSGVSRRYTLRAVQTGDTFEDTVFSLQLCALDYEGETLTGRVCKALD
jgi:hypothetical protein